jgi:hypothetical protein
MMTAANGDTNNFDEHTTCFPYSLLLRLPTHNMRCFSRFLLWHSRHFPLVVIVGDKVHTTWLEKGIYIDAILAKVRYGISSSITGANIASSIEGGEGR